MCPECYSEFSRITPLIEPEACLKNHRQYVCQTCGRCICVNRGLFPFKTIEVAKLYLRSTEAVKGLPCGIYELEAFYPKMKRQNKVRKSFKIFEDQDELETYLKKSKNKTTRHSKPIFKATKYKSKSEKHLRALTSIEIDTYLKEKDAQSYQWLDFVKEHIGK